MTCVDSRKNLPPPCPSNRQVYDCIEVQWSVHTGVTNFEICDGMLVLNNTYNIIFKAVICRFWCFMPEIHKWFHED